VQATDGIPLSGLPMEGPAGRATHVALRDFRGLGPAVTSPRATEPADEPPVVERPLLIVIGTDGDHHVDWLRAGMAMQRLWLTATAAGLGASPLTQALDHEGPRALLSRIVGLENGHPQMLLRVGFSNAEQVTGRRPVADVLVHQ
jgi:nitroreductase